MKKTYFRTIIVFCILLIISSVLYFVLIDKSFFGIIQEVDDRSPFLSIVFAGDAIPHTSVREIGKNGFSSILRFIENEISADLFFYNLETTVLNNPKPPIPFYFSVDPSFVEDLADNKFMNFTIANNHMLDYGKYGYLETISHVKNYNSAGYREKNKVVTKIITTESLTIGFLGFTTLINGNYAKSDTENYAFYLSLTEDLKAALEELKTNSDIIVCAVHWGNEYDEMPNEFQRELAYTLINNGVDIVWGHHPHVVQPFEMYNDKLILYSNGNFLSSQASTYINEKNDNYHKNYFYSRISPIIKVSLNTVNKNVEKIELFPYFQFNNFHIKKKNKYEMFLYNAMSLIKTDVSKLNENHDSETYEILKWNLEKSFLSINNSIEFVAKVFFYFYPYGYFTNKDSFELNPETIHCNNFNKPGQR